LTSPERPDIVLIVLDCVRAREIADAETFSALMPFLHRLAGESLNFTNVVSPSPWTIPSHASLFTGLYPWSHKVHLKATLKLNPRIPTIAGILRARGYKTFSASANGFVCPDVGLTRGFTDSHWGAWWEKYLKIPILKRAPHTEHRDGSYRAIGIPKSLEPLLAATLRHPSSLNYLNWVVSRVADVEQSRAPVVSSWIEPEFRTWLHARSQDEPIFAFFNFMDAHEPYVPGDFGRNREPLAPDHRLPRMDKSGQMAGLWTPTEEDVRGFTVLYRETLSRLDSRVRLIWEELESCGRAERAVFAVTSDHGQSLGEDGVLFHAQVSDESVLRVPLILRDPTLPIKAGVVREWVSLVDLAPTFLRRVGIEGTDLDGLAIQDFLEGGRPVPVGSLGDGLHPRDVVWKLTSKGQASSWNQVWLAAYMGNKKLVYYPEAGKLIDEQLPDQGTAGGHDPDSVALPWIRMASNQFAYREGRSEDDQAITARLKSWGYV